MPDALSEKKFELPIKTLPPCQPEKFEIEKIEWLRHPLQWKTFFLEKAKLFARLNRELKWKEKNPGKQVDDIKIAELGEKKRQEGHFKVEVGDMETFSNPRAKDTRKEYEKKTRKEKRSS